MAQPDALTIYIGTVSGPIFGLIDAREWPEGGCCVETFLKSIPPNLLSVDQIVFLIDPKTISPSGCICRHIKSGCSFRSSRTQETPTTDYLLRAWFTPNNGRIWVEASVSYGGLILASEYLKHFDNKKEWPYVHSLESPLQHLDL